MESGSFIEIPDPNANDYEPTDKEIEDYAEWLGADLKNDRDLFWIARDALKAKIPPGWKLYQRKDGSGDPFYFNSDTGESLWDHPLDSHFKKLFAEEKEKKLQAQRSQNQYSVSSNTRPLAALGKGGSLTQKSPTGASSVAPKSLLPMKQTVLPKSSLQGSPIQQNNNNYAQLQQQKDELEAQLKVDMEVLRRKARIEQETLQAQNQKEIEAIQQQHQQRINDLKQRVAQEESNFQDRLQSVIENKNKLNQEYSETVSKYTQLMQSAEEDYRDQKRRAERECNEAIERMKEDNRREIERLKEIHNREVNSIKESKPSNNSVEKDLTSDHQKDINDLKQKFEKEIEDLKKEHQNEVARLKEQNENEIQDIRTLHLNQIQELNDKYDQEVNDMKSKHQKDMSKFEETGSITLDITDDSLLKDLQSVRRDAPNKDKLIKEQNDEINKIKKDHEQNVKNIKESNEKEINNIKSEHKKKVDELNSNNDKELKEIKTKFQEEANKQQNNIDELKKKNENELNKLKEEHQSQLDSMDEEFEKQKSDMKQKFDADLDKLNKMHQRKLSRRKQELEDEEESSFEEEMTPKSSRKENQLRRELDSLRDQYNAAISAQENQKVQMEQAEANHKLQLELLQAKFDVEKHQTEINHQKELDLARNSTPPPSPSLSQSWRRFASFQQFSRPPSSVAQLKTSKAFSYSIRYVPELSTANYIQASIMPQMNPNTPRPIQMIGDFQYHPPFSRMSEPIYHPPNTDRPMPPPAFEYSGNLSEKLLKQMKSQQGKLERVREKFDASYSNLSVSMKEAIADVYSLINGYKNVISEQNKSLSQLSLDFQQQTARMARNFRESINEVENAYKIAVANAIQQPQYVVSSNSPRSARRPQKLQLQTPSVDFTSEDSGEEVIRNFLNWKKQQKSAKRQKYDN